MEKSKMSRAEELAKAYEENLDYYHCMNDWPSIAYRAGYEQAEKDLADAFQAEYAKKLARADLAEFISLVKQMRHAQAEFRRTRISGWDYAAQKLEAKIDKLIKQLEDDTENKH